MNIEANNITIKIFDAFVRKGIKKEIFKNLFIGNIINSFGRQK